MLRKTKYQLAGVVPIINTPWTDKGTVDYPSIGRLVQGGISDGISGCIVPAVASEVSKLSNDERIRLLEEVIEVADGQIPVIAGVSDPDVKRAQKLADHAIRAGADGVLCAVPTEINHEKTLIKTFFTQLTQVELPMLMIQDLSWGDYGTPLDAITEMFQEIDSFRCLKLETVPAGYKLSQLIKATDHLMPVGVGWSLPQLIEALDRDANFITTTAVNKPFVHILRHYYQGERDTSIEIFNRTLPYLAWAHQHIDISIHFYKLYCHRKGWFTNTHSREPISPFDTHHLRIANEIIDHLFALEEELG